MQLSSVYHLRGLNDKTFKSIHNIFGQLKVVRLWGDFPCSILPIFQLRMKTGFRFIE